MIQILLPKRGVARLFFEPKDIWVGVYVHGEYWEASDRRWRVYICLFPCLPLMLDFAL